jgi:hypothetical protein
MLLAVNADLQRGVVALNTDDDWNSGGRRLAQPE